MAQGSRNVPDSGARPGRLRLVTADVGLPMEVITVAGRAAEVVFWIRVETVEVLLSGEVLAVFRRPVLKEWLRRPWRALVAGDVGLMLDRSANPGGRVAVSLPDVGLWPLSPHVVASLRDRV